MTHCMSTNDAPRARPIAGSDTATMLLSSMINDDTSELVSRIGKPDEGAVAWFWSAMAVKASSVGIRGGRGDDPDRVDHNDAGQNRAASMLSIPSGYRRR